jgi:beta-lactamase class A
MSMRRFARRLGHALVGTGALLLATLALADDAPGPVAAQPLTPREALARLFTAERLEPDWFTAEVLAQAPITQLQMIIDGLRDSLGAFEGVNEAGGAYEVVFSGGVVPARITLDAQGRIAGLFFSPPRARSTGGPEALVQELAALPGSVSVLVLEDGRERVARHADAPGAVGSTFKLAILAALRRQIDAGQRSWSDVVELRPEWKSLPTGILQTWPDGTPITLATLAALMISQSDNTATDALLFTVGREVVEEESPRNRPFLSTREAFVLKGSANRDLLDRFRAGGEAERRVVLGETAARPLPAAAEFDGGPVATDIEWFFSARELCGLMERVADLPLMGINPGLASRNDWTRVAYKGGSEPGVLNTTHWTQAKDGRRVCISATWNHDARLDDTRFFALVGGLLDTLK